MLLLCCYSSFIWLPFLSLFPFFFFLLCVLYICCYCDCTTSHQLLLFIFYLFILRNLMFYTSCWYGTQQPIQLHFYFLYCYYNFIFLFLLCLIKLSFLWLIFVPCYCCNETSSFIFSYKSLFIQTFSSPFHLSHLLFSITSEVCISIIFIIFHFTYHWVPYIYLIL